MRENGRRIFLSGGGTGGHLYPGLAIVEALRRLDPDVAVALSCTRKAIDRKILEPLGVPFTPIDARPAARQPWKWPGLAWSLLRTSLQVRRRFREFCPDVVIGLGGYGSYTPVRVGQKTGAATAVLNPDIVPGKANRRLARRADRVYCQFEETAADLGDVARLTGCPIRPSLLGGRRDEAVAEFGLRPDLRTLLVTGASSGARTVNRAVVALLRERGLPDGWQVLHLTGHGEYDEVRAAYEDVKTPAVVRDYCDRMGLAYAVADAAVARAGASSVAEVTATALPTVFMPYPFHRDQHQLQQARAVESLGAATVVVDDPDDPGGTWRRLADALVPLLGETSRLEAMRMCARGAGRPDAADVVARDILALADGVIQRRHAALTA
jgi:UDP-N-acetylglucosamine--N-acetylmuramyl-(pentapeptide) pyrophosphoryl-undecaprenol N-acetylglucosamine transferase